MTNIVKTTKDLFNQDNVKAKFTEMLGKRAPQFITSVLQIASQNQMLANADAMSIYNAAAVAATLDLPLNSQLGFAYIVPFNTRQSDGSFKVMAQFMIGYKGFIQLAQRSGQYKTIAATPIYEGQIVETNPLTGHTFDFTKKSDKVIGYAAYFELLNGFQKTLYMTVEEIKSHGSRYSKTFKNNNGLWNTDFDAMATKTVIKLLLAKFAPLSVEMQKAVVNDQAVVMNDDGTDVEYVDHEEVVIDKEAERIVLLIQDATKIEDLQAIEQNVDDEHRLLFDQKMEQLKASANGKANKNPKQIEA